MHTTHVIALSGGKDSSALALRMHELQPDFKPIYLITPTGDELPEMVGHWARLEKLLGAKLTVAPGPSLRELVKHFCRLPNPRQRWCTRMIKIAPAIAWLKAHSPAVQYVGLRADEEARKGLFSPDVDSRYPLRDWGWGLSEVQEYLADRGVEIPQRTDCARCPYQRLGEWWRLWRHHPAIFSDAELQEVWTGGTFRSPSRDTWPAALGGLRQEFESGRIPRGAETDDRCRVCSM